MKKLTALLLAVMLVASMAVVASAESTTTLTTTVPAATYTLNIPADQEIPFGATETVIGSVTVTNANGFAVGKNLHVTITYDEFINNTVSTKIPFEVYMGGKLYGSASAGNSTEKNYTSGSYLVFPGLVDSSVRELPRDTSSIADFDEMIIKIKSTDWGKALGGDYTATITFTAEVVAE